MAIFVGSALFLLSGCGKEEIQKLRSENQVTKKENEELKAKIASLVQEIAKLKETAEFHYQQGIDFLKDNKFQEAKTEFDTVVEKYPDSLFVSPAKENLKKMSREIRRVEAEKLVAEEKSPAEAKSEWMTFRQNEKANEGKVVTWKCAYRLTYNFRGSLGAIWNESLFYLENDSTKTVIVDGGPSSMHFGYYREKTDSKWEQAGKDTIKRDDLVLITGKFRSINDDGQIQLDLIKIKRIGYGGP